MRPDEFIEMVDSEPFRVVAREVATEEAATLLAEGAKSGAIRLADFLATRRPSAERRDVRYQHVIGPPATPAEVESWQERHPHHPLPADLRALVTRFNGINLWADSTTGRGYIGLLPLRDWAPARILMYGQVDPGMLSDKYLGLSYHQDGAAYVVLDVESGNYFLMDVAGPDESSLIGNSVEDVLRWFWENRIPPK
jgi:hypothetical protein